ncbi:MAG: NAD-dependent epimerase/dehydratase family protein, partial [Planctomycetota bacterium]
MLDDAPNASGRPGRALVTGGAGFIGSHLVDRLLARGDEVVVVDDLSTGVRENLPASHPRLAFVQADLRDWLDTGAAEAGRFSRTPVERSSTTTTSSPRASRR